MIRRRHTTSGWAVQWRSKNRLDGRTENLLGGVRYERPSQFAGYVIMVFASRAAARKFIKDEFGYIVNRQDLKDEPHGWEMPRPVRVKVTVAQQRG